MTIKYPFYISYDYKLCSIPKVPLGHTHKIIFSIFYSYKLFLNTPHNYKFFVFKLS